MEQKENKFVKHAKSALTFRPNNPLGSGAIELIAPAKINLFLNVKEKLASGLHGVDTIMHTLALHDVLYMKRCFVNELPEKFEKMFHGSKGLKTPVFVVMHSCEGLPYIHVAPSENIVYKAVENLCQASGKHLSKNECICVHVEKHIPAQAGLAGGSTDGAAALLGAARLLGISESDEAIGACASKLGADVSFFLNGGCAKYSGIGEVFEQNLEQMKKNVLLVKPEGGLSTALVYSEFDRKHEQPPDVLLRQSQLAQCASEVPLCNNMMPAAEFLCPEISKIRHWLEGRFGQNNVLMSGSGSCVFALCESFDYASQTAKYAREKGWWVQATSTANFKAGVL